MCPGSIPKSGATSALREGSFLSNPAGLEMMQSVAFGLALGRAIAAVALATRAVA